MSKRPAGDLGTLAVSKAAASEAVPFMPASPPAPSPIPPTSAGLPRSLTVKLDAATYARLRAYCFAREQVEGARLTHQEVMVRALTELLVREGA